MTLIVISIDRNALPEHTDEDFARWVRYQLGETGDIKLTNPLCDEKIKAVVREIG